MAVQGDPVPNPPQHDPAIEERETGVGRFARSWMQWFLLLREKINVINALLVSLSKVTGTGFLSLSDGTWFTRTHEGPMSVEVLNGDGAAGNPVHRLKGDELTPPGLSVYGVDHLNVQHFFRPPVFESTGVLTGGTLALTGGNTFSIDGVTVGQTDYSNPTGPPRTVRTVGPFVGQTVPNIAVLATWVGINVATGLPVMQSSIFTATQSRTIAQLGAIISNGVNLIAVNNLPSVLRAGINQVQDLMSALGPINRSGNVISPNGANLSINKSAGVEFKQGSNFINNVNDPHNLPLAALIAPNTMAYRLSTGTQFANTAFIDPNNWENPLGTLTNILGANRFTIQRIYVFTSNLIRIQYGQVLYLSMAAAEASLATEAFVTEQNIAENGLLLAFLIVRDSTTDLTDATRAKFIPASKFGGPVGAGGSTITNTDSLPEGLVNLYFTDARARAAAVQDAIVDGVTTIAPSQNAVFDALALKQNTITPGTLGQFLRGDLTMSNMLITDGATQELFLRSYNGAPRLFGQRANGTLALPTAVPVNTNILALNGDGWDGFDFFTGASIQYLTSEAWSATGHGGQILFRTVPNGTTSIATCWIMGNDGNFVPSGSNRSIGSNTSRVAGLWSNLPNFFGDANHTLEGLGNSGYLGFKYVDDNTGFQFRASKSRGTVLVPLGVQTSDTIVGFQGRTQFTTAGVASGFTGNIGDMQLSALEPHTNLARGTGWSLSVTQLGGLLRADRLRVFYTHIDGGATDNVTDLGASTLRWKASHIVNTNRYGSLFDNGISSMASLAADVNDWVITNMANVHVVRCGATGAVRTITGIVAPTPASGQRLKLVNITTLDLILPHDSASSVAANRFITPNTAPYRLSAGGSVDLWYDITTARWRVQAEATALDYGTYTPTLTNTTNITGSSAYQAQYMRVGNVVTVSGKVDIDPTTTATVAELRMTLPIASSMGADNLCAGVATNNGGKTARILGLISATGQARLVTSNDIDDVNRGWQYTYTYLVG